MASSHLTIYIKKQSARAVSLYLLSALAFTSFLTVTRIGTTLHDRGVAIPQEMAVGELFFAWLPTLQGICAPLSSLFAMLGVIIGLMVWRRDTRSSSVLLMLVGGSFALGEMAAERLSGVTPQLMNLIGLLVIGAALWRSSAQAHRSTLMITYRALTERSGHTWLRDISLLSAATALGWSALFTIEMITYTSRFTPHLISPQSFSSFIVYGFAVITLSALSVTAAFLIAQRLSEWVGQRLRRAAKLSDITIGLVGFATPHVLILLVIIRLFRGAVGQEIDGLGLNLHLTTLITALSLLGWVTHMRSFSWVYAKVRCERRFFSSYLTSLISLPLTWLFARRVRSVSVRSVLRSVSEEYPEEVSEEYPEEVSEEYSNLTPLSGPKHCALVLISSLIILYPLMKLTFPHIEDMTAAGGSIFGVLISATVLIAGWSLVSARLGDREVQRGLSIALLSILIGSILIVIPKSGSQELRVISDQYMKVFTGLFDRAHLVLNTPWNLGFEGPGPKPWSPYEARHERYAPHPAYPLLKPEETPIVLVIWDAGRPDRMSLYGYGRPTTPHLDALRDDFFIFDQAISGGTATSIGMKTLFSGHYSTRYMLEQERVDPFWTQELLKQGYRDFILNVFGTDYNGISLEAFRRYLSEEYRDLGRYTFVDGDHSSQRKLEQLTVKLRAQAQRGNQRYLLSMHLVDTHSPWRMHDSGSRFGETLSDRYDHNVAYSDQITGALFAEMKRLGVWDQSLVILLADHGTGLNEHGRYAGFRPYQEQIKVPLLIKLPRRRGGVVISEPVSLIDIGPTITHLFEEGSSNRFDGVSLLPLMLSRGREPLARRHLMSLNAFNDSYAVIEDGRWKWIMYRRDRYLQLFDLQADPRELRNLADDPQHKERIRAFKEMMRSFLDRGRDTYNAPLHYYPYDPETFRY